MSDDDCKCRDEMTIGPPVGQDGTHACIRHTADHQVSMGFVRPVKDGQPLSGAELVSLDHIEDNRFAVTSVYGASEPCQAEAPASKTPGPAKVTSPAFRNGWDRIFGKKQEVGQA